MKILSCDTSKYQYFTGILILILVSRFFGTIIDIVYGYYVCTYVLGQHQLLVNSVFQVFLVSLQLRTMTAFWF